jgi:hypothetical protein
MLLVTLVFAISLFALEFFTQAQPPIDEKIKAVVQEGFFLGYKLKRGEPSPRLKKVLTRIVQVNLDDSGSDVRVRKASAAKTSKLANRKRRKGLSSLFFRT